MPQYLSSFSVFSPGFWYVVFVGSRAQKWKKLHHSGVVIENMLKHIMHKPRFCWKQKAPVAVGIFACSKILRQESCQDLVAYCHRARPVCVYEKEKPSQKWKQLSSLGGFDGIVMTRRFIFLQSMWLSSWKITRPDKQTSRFSIESFDLRSLTRELSNQGKTKKKGQRARGKKRATVVARKKGNFLLNLAVTAALHISSSKATTTTYTIQLSSVSFFFLSNSLAWENVSFEQQLWKSSFSSQLEKSAKVLFAAAAAFYSGKKQNFCLNICTNGFFQLTCF